MGEHPLGRVRQSVAALKPGEMARVTSACHTAPLIDVLRRGGLAVYSVKAEPGRHVTYVSR